MDKKKFYNKACVIAYIGVAVCFVGFVLGGMVSVSSVGPNFLAILVPFFGFAIFGFIATYAYRHSEFYDRNLQSMGRNLGIRNSQKQVLIKCQYCDHLNEEHAKYCNECGNRL